MFCHQVDGLDQSAQLRLEAVEIGLLPVEPLCNDVSACKGVELCSVPHPFRGTSARQAIVQETP